MNGEIQQHLDRLRAFGGLRRELRVLEDLEGIARVALRFAVDVLGCARAALYCAEKEDGDYVRLAVTDETRATPASIERSSPLGQALADAVWTTADPIVTAFGEGEPMAAAVALRGSAGQPLGALLVAGARLDEELLGELAFDVESVLAVRLIAQLRAEELAVLEIQERELVGLLRDVEARDEIIQRDLEEARRFQRQMLGTPPRIAGAAVEVVYTPLGLVGGDLYAVSAEDRRVRMFVADATGHGVRASLTTMFIKSGYEAVRRSAPDPASLLAALNETIAHTYRSAEMLFSAVCVDLDLDTGRLWIASAAHPPACIVRAGAPVLLEAGGAFLGLRPGMKFGLHEDRIAPGDGVYLYTDGFVEARKGQEQFGDERFQAAIVDAHVRGEKAGAAVLAAVTEFLAGGALEDDGTFVGLRFGVEDDSVPSVRSV
ncbi:MAG: serine/threonine-protein phosphatase [Labilithrix sp.]|nr:serine/threonine-protein phosphatase [Labilithrix sp.]MCW5813000.1 serine/threonine-protein phosphatase [Labilithrix sp.]